MTQLLKILFLIAIIALPWSFEYQINDGLKLNLLIELLIPLILILTGIKLSRRSSYSILQPYKPLLLAALALIVAYLFSTVSAYYPIASVKATVKLSAYLTTFLVVPLLLDLKRKDWRNIWILYLSSYNLLMFYGLVKLFIIGIGYHNSYQFVQPFSPGHTIFLISGAPAIFWAIDHMIKTKRISILILPVLLFIVLGWLSYSRFFWVFIPFATSLFLLFRYNSKIKYIVPAILLVAIAGASWYAFEENKRFKEKAWENQDDYGTVFRQIKGIFSTDNNESNRERQNKTNAIFYFFAQNRISGIGANNFMDAYHEHSENFELDETSLTSLKMNPHHLFLGSLAETGIIGFLSLMTLLALIILKVFENSKVIGRISFLLLLSCFLLLGLKEDYLLLDEVIGGFWIFVAYMFHVNNGLVKHPENIDL